jgi:Uma2 family endonuclease
MSTKAPMTFEQFAQLQTADTEDYELVEGELRPLSSGTYRHNRIRDLIGYLLWSYFTQNPIGEAVAEYDCQIAPTKSAVPIFRFFSTSTWAGSIPTESPHPRA